MLCFLFFGFVFLIALWPVASTTGWAKPNPEYEFLSRPICSPSGLPVLLWLAGYGQGFPTVWLAARTVLFGILGHRGCKWTIEFQPFSALPQPPLSPYFTDLRGYLKRGRHQDTHSSISINFQTQKVVLVMSISMSSFNAPLKFR